MKANFAIFRHDNLNFISNIFREILSGCHRRTKLSLIQHFEKLSVSFFSAKMLPSLSNEEKIEENIQTLPTLWSYLLAVFHRSVDFGPLRR